MDSRALEPFCPHPAGLVRVYRPSRHRKRGDCGRTDHQQGECCGAAEEDSRERVLPRDGPIRLAGAGPRLGQAQGRLDGQNY